MSTNANDAYPVTGLEVGRAVVERPFRQNGDVSSIVVHRKIKQRGADFAPMPFSTPDVQYPDAYLVGESDPSPTDTGLVAFVRDFARIPTVQSVPATVALTRPALSGTFPQPYGSFRVFQPDTTLLKYDAYAAKTVTSDSGASVLYPSGGTYTLTYASNTTGALNYNDTAATVQTALNALGPIANQGGVTVAGTYNSAGGFTITFNSYALLTLNLGSITVSGGSKNDTSFFGSTWGYYQRAQMSTTGGYTVTGGTFTVTIFGQTTAAIAYNATPSAVSTALNALSGVTNRGGCTVTMPFGNPTILEGSPNQGFGFDIRFTNAIATGSAASLTPVGSALSIVDGGRADGSTQKLTFSATTGNRTIIAIGHGITPGDTIYIKGDSTYYAGITAFTASDPDTIVLAVVGSSPYAAAASITEVGRRSKQGYAPGSFVTRCKKITTFYLPGISPGVATSDDIVTPASQGDNDSVLQAAFSGSGSINYQVGDLTVWRGPILSITATTVKATDL